MLFLFDLVHVLLVQLVNISKFALRKYGAVAEWLGRGLQNLVQRFESAQRLIQKHPSWVLFLFHNTTIILFCLAYERKVLCKL